MAHVLVLREAISFVEVPDAVYGVDERLDQAIERRKYVLNKGRNGYNTPQVSEIKFKVYRVKKEIMSEFLADLNVINLNPKTLPKGVYWSLVPKFVRRIFISQKRWDKIVANNHYATVGTLIQLIQIFMHWVCKLPFIPLKSVDRAEKDGKTFTIEWNYNYCLGYLDDIDRGYGEEL